MCVHEVICWHSRWHWSRKFYGLNRIAVAESSNKSIALCVQCVICTSENQKDHANFLPPLSTSWRLMLSNTLLLEEEQDRRLSRKVEWYPALVGKDVCKDAAGICSSKILCSMRHHHWEPKAWRDPTCQSRGVWLKDIRDSFRITKTGIGGFSSNRMILDSFDHPESLPNRKRVELKRNA